MGLVNVLLCTVLVAIGSTALFGIAASAFVCFTGWALLVGLGTIRFCFALNLNTNNNDKKPRAMACIGRVSDAPPAMVTDHRITVTSMTIRNASAVVINSRNSLSVEAGAENTLLVGVGPNGSMIVQGVPVQDRNQTRRSMSIYPLDGYELELRDITLVNSIVKMAGGLASNNTLNLNVTEGSFVTLEALDFRRLVLGMAGASTVIGVSTTTQVLEVSFSGPGNSVSTLRATRVVSVNANGAQNRMLAISTNHDTEIRASRRTRQWVTMDFARPSDARSSPVPAFNGLFPYQLDCGITIPPPPPSFPRPPPRPTPPLTVGIIEFRAAPRLIYAHGQLAGGNVLGAPPPYQDGPSDRVRYGMAAPNTTIDDDAKKETRALDQKNKSEAACSVCIVNYANVLITPCGCPAFCGECLPHARARLPNGLCPLCRKPVADVMLRK
jgi:hypothetical protein